MEGKIQKVTYAKKQGALINAAGECALGFEAPTLRTVATVAAAVAATVVATVVTAGAASPVAGALAASAASSAITVGNELVFAMADYNGGYRSAYEIGKGLGTSLATSALSAAGGAAGAAGAAVKGIGGVGGVALRTGISSSNTIATQAASTYISSGGDAWAVKKSFDSVHGWSGVISSTAGSLVMNSMNATFLEDVKGNALNEKVFDNANIKTLTNLSGGLTSSAVNFGLNGNATFNVVSIEGQGVLELTLGKDGISSRLGTGGTNISYQTLKSSVIGAKESGRIAGMKYGGRYSASVLTGLNELSYYSEENQAIAKELLKNETKIYFSPEEDGKVLSETEFYFNEDGTVTISDSHELPITNTSYREKVRKERNAFNKDGGYNILKNDDSESVSKIKESGKNLQDSIIDFLGDCLAESEPYNWSSELVYSLIDKGRDKIKSLTYFDSGDVVIGPKNSNKSDYKCNEKITVLEKTTFDIEVPKPEINETFAVISGKKSVIESFDNKILDVKLKNQKNDLNVIAGLKYSAFGYRYLSEYSKKSSNQFNYKIEGYLNSKHFSFGVGIENNKNLNLSLKWHYKY